MLSTSLLILAFTTLSLARTDLTGCTSTDVSSPAGASLAWYVPGTGELCDFLDCGGGQAPPKTDVPGCPEYSGTQTYSPSYNTAWASATGVASSGWTEATATASTTWTQSTSAVWSAGESDTVSSSWDLYTTAPTTTESWSSISTPSTSSSPWTANTDVSSWSSSIVSVPTFSGVLNSTTSVASGNSTAPSATAPASSLSPSSTTTNGAAAATAVGWMGSAALMAGLGAVVVGL